VTGQEAELVGQCMIRLNGNYRPRQLFQVYEGSWWWKCGGTVVTVLMCVTCQPSPICSPLELEVVFAASSPQSVSPSSSFGQDDHSHLIHHQAAISRCISVVQQIRFACCTCFERLLFSSVQFSRSIPDKRSNTTFAVIQVNVRRSGI
jgi:hypothetical protein